MSACPCPKHPFGCFGHPHSCGCSAIEDAKATLAAASYRILAPGQLENLEAEWTRPDALRLKAGEMTAQEMRTAQSVIRGFAAAIRAMQEKEDG